MSLASDETQAGRPPAADMARVLDPAALAKVLEVANAAAMTAGEVNIFSLAAIARNAGPAWAARREEIYHHTARILHRLTQGRGSFQRVSEQDFVVVQPGAGRDATQTLCFDAVREILSHYVGRAMSTDAVLFEVTRIEGESVHGLRVDASRIDDDDTWDVQTRPRSLDSAFGVSAAPFVTCDGRAVRVSCVLEPLYHLRNSQRIGYRVSRQVVETRNHQPLSRAEEHNLATADIERIDFATLARGLSRLSAESPDKKLPTLVLPITFLTLATPRGRARLIDYLERANDVVRLGVVCEVRDIEFASPEALATACAAIRPYCISLVGYLGHISTRGLRRLRHVGFQGLSTDCPNVDGEAQLMGWSRALSAAVTPVAKTVMVYGVPSLRQAAVISLMGVTHATLKRG